MVGLDILKFCEFCLKHKKDKETKVCMLCFFIIINLCRSATPEEYTKKDELLDGLVELYKDELQEKNQISQAIKATEEKAEQDKSLGLKILCDATVALGEKQTNKTTKGKCKES